MLVLIFGTFEIAVTPGSVSAGVNPEVRSIGS